LPINGRPFLVAGAPVGCFAVIYLDYAASAPMHPDAVEAMHEWMTGGFGNPSGSHSVARRAKAAIEDAREVVADFIGVEPAGVVFTSGGTEADNLAVAGAIAANPSGPSGRGPAPIVVSAVEHPAVAEAARAAQARGHEVRILGVGEDGVVDLDQLRQLVDPEVALVAVQTANHETGVIQPIEGIASAFGSGRRRPRSTPTRCRPRPGAT